MYGDMILFGMCMVAMAVFAIVAAIDEWLKNRRNPQIVSTIPNSVEFNEREMKVFKQIMEAIVMFNPSGFRWSLKNELLNINNAEYVKNFVPGPGQIRLDKAEWDAFVAKLKSICEVQ